MTREIAAQTSERTYILPHPFLRSVISHYTLFHPKSCQNLESGEKSIHIVPDASGCIVCILNSAGLDLQYWGPTSKVVVVDRKTVPPFAIFVEFVPGGASRLLGMPVQSLQDLQVPLDCVDPKLHHDISQSFCKSWDIKRKTDYFSFIDLLDQIFMVRIASGNSSPLAIHILSTLKAVQGVIRVGELADITGYSARHLNRVMSNAFGMNIKLLSRIIKVNSACQAMFSSELTLTAVAQSMDYHDQAHFIHDFSAICGVTPGEYRSKMSVFYNEELKLNDTIIGR